MKKHTFLKIKTILKNPVAAAALLLCLALILADIITSLSITRQYPQLVIHTNNLFAGDTEALTLQEDGSILSGSEDPWAYYALPKTMGVKEIEVVTESVSSEGMWSELFFILDNGEWIYQNYHMHTGINRVKVSDGAGLGHVTAVRFDLFCADGDSAKIDKITINNWVSLTSRYHVRFLAALFVLLILLVAAFLFEKIKKHMQADGGHMKTPAAAAVLLLFVILIVADVIGSLSAILRYPQIVIHTNDLFDRDSKALTLQEDRGILSESEDPWAYYGLPETMGIKEIKIITDSVSSEGIWSELFFILDSGEWNYQNYRMYTGTNKVKVSNGAGLDNVMAVRFDLFCADGDSAKIDKIIINSRASLTFKYHLPLLAALFILFIVVLLPKRVKEYTQSDFKEFFAGLWPAGAVVFLLLFFAPLDLYFNNKWEFWFDIYKLLPVVLLMFLAGIVSVGILAVFLFMLHKKAYQAGMAVCFILLVCSYIQGNYLSGNLPPMDGTPFSWGNYASGKTATIILWCIVVAAVFLLCLFLHREKFYVLLKYASVGMTAVLLLTLGMECITTKGYQDKLDARVTTEKQFEMSQDKNFVILVLDALDAGTFGTMLESHPEYREIFADFTYYPDTVGAYSFTSRSIPFIISGEWFENEEAFEHYHENAYEDSPLLSQLEQEGYKLGIYEPDLPVTYNNMQRFENVIECNTVINSYADFIRYEWMLTGFKYAPFNLKKYCLINTKDFNYLKKDEAKNNHPTTWFSGYNTQFYEELRQEDVTYADQKCFKFIHIEGAHVPFRYDKDMNVIENGTYEQNIEASITVTKTYLEKLKKAGVYDNSVVMVMADHGYAWNPEYECGRQNPLLMIKGINEKHELNISNAPVSYDDLQEIYRRLLDGKSSDKTVDWQEGDERERRFLMYLYLEDDFMTEYMQRGKASDPASAYPTGRVFNRYR